ncbi:TRAP transporter substrate-binding protein [Desulfatitalea alkaliphila]|uniref:TRAP transporter substrate-binding protein n=1 Tax=Desulfatitalea alkaliphila TaxID=2929485 RepID=A0AA41R609_9BACT|nr:TRAP transporter substrate-binding protein [Desulfatitalea alkaliphila]MCJ8501521.1 TRAP transporter substrate-binding protein [Desulfatitalea alkaliphila]
MKHKLMIAVVVAAMLVAGTVAVAAAQELRIVGSWNSLTLFKNFEQPFWSEVVPEEMGIKTSVTSLGQVNLRGAAVFRQMDMGVFDVVHTVIDYVVEDSPALAGLDLPALALDLELARKVVDAYIPVLDEYLAKDFGIKLLSVTPYPAQILFSRDRISSLSDLRGKKIRASGWTTAEFINAVGATGVTLSFSEVPQAMQRGVVDGAVTGSLSGYSAGWGEVSNYIYPLPIGGWDYVIGTISLKTWERFTPEQQTKLQQLIKDRLETPAWEVTARETVEGIECLGGGECPHGRPGNLEILALSEADKARSNQILLENVLPAWAGKVPPEVVQKWNATIGEVVGLQAK